MMRFGIALPDDGPLAGPAAVEATAQAARELDYASVWSRSTSQLILIAAHVGRLPIGWLASESLGAQGFSLLGGVLVEAKVAGRLGSKLTYVGAHESDIAALRRELPGSLLLDTADDRPVRDDADGWSPHRLAAAGSRLPARKHLHWGLVILRMAGRPTDDELHDAQTAQVDELVVALPTALTLDEQLAGFADVAERVAACLQNAG